MGDDFRAARAQGNAAEAAGFGVDFFALCIGRGWPLDGGVGGHDAGKRMARGEVEHIVDSFDRKIRCDFYKEWHDGIYRAQDFQNFIQGTFVLQLTQFGRVGRADVDHKKIRQALQRAK